MSNNIVLIAAGGTGGHIFPGLAIAEEFLRRGYEPQWLGTKAGMESKLVPQHAIKIHYFPVSGIRGKSVIAKCLAPLNVIRALFSAMWIIRSINPKLVIGMGGFVSGPAGLASYLLRIPLVIHEQNAVAGTSNRLLARIATRVLCAFPCNLKRAEVIGNPVRSAFESIKRTFDKNKSTINVLVLGGSRGARALNLSVPASLEKANLGHLVKVRHQCGSGRLHETLSAYQNAKIDSDVVEFIDDVVDAFAWADLLVCRAGALTVSEVAAAGVASIMVPYPYAIDDHQTENARFLERFSATNIVQESEFESGKLVATLKNLIGNPERLLEMSSNAKAAAKYGVSGHFVDMCESLSGVSA